MTWSLLAQTAATPYTHSTLPTNSTQRAAPVVPQQPADAGQKQKKKRIRRDFQETALWEHDEHRQDDIEDFTRSELKIVNDRAGLSVMPGAQKRRDDHYGLFGNGQHMGYQEGLHIMSS